MISLKLTIDRFAKDYYNYRILTYQMLDVTHSLV